MAQFYYVKDGQRVGPFDLDQLAQQGLTPETLVWTEGMTNWAPAAQIPALASIFAPKPEPAPALAPQPAPAPAPQPVQQPAPQPVQQPAPQPAPQPQYQAPQPQYQQPQPQYQQPQYQQPYQQAYQQQPAGNYVATPQLGFMDAIKRCLSKYADFNGRARRSEFWWFWLACYLLNFILYIPVSILMSKKTQLIQDTMYGRISFAEADAKDPTTLIIILCIIMGIVGLALLIPQLSAMCRRLHDVGKSGHMMWLFLVCGIGGLVPLIMCIPDGKPEPNQYGESPKYVLQQ